MNVVFAEILHMLRSIHKSRYKKESPAGFSSDNVQVTGQSSSDLIKEKLLAGKPAMIARFGSGELTAALAYHFAQLPEPWTRKAWRYICQEYPEFWWDRCLSRGLTRNAGFFPADEKLYDRFAALLIDDMHYVDVLGSWLSGERVFETQLASAVKIGLDDLQPYRHANPWSEALAGKTVLVIHPFTKSIAAQYQKRELLFDDPRVLPEFELKTITAVQSIAFNTKSPFGTWFDALDHMSDQMARTEFDVAIIGCGAYGFPLAARAKRLGKQAVHLGGATQLLFGVNGKRWGDIGNQHWVRPLPEERPPGFETIEGGCYW
ncbi:hypothetical protein GMLC_13800 [Geomonas limicola]|uniref:Uncharacterized protein n=2 Tax=Geomonas limicola TaxID=2740186 RepID=A0A6V8N5R8_9BACT|nr:hypothetical protein GMLC_13800 [Geomonas limicola]